jgi:hypothetical protein
MCVFFLRYTFPAVRLRREFQGTSKKCREQFESKADGAQKPECTQST